MNAAVNSIADVRPHLQLSLLIRTGSHIVNAVAASVDDDAATRKGAAYNVCGTRLMSSVELARKS